MTFQVGFRQINKATGHFHIKVGILQLSANAWGGMVNPSALAVLSVSSSESDPGADMAKASAFDTSSDERNGLAAVSLRSDRLDQSWAGPAISETTPSRPPIAAEMQNHA
jgi:hypothetical protein